MVICMESKEDILHKINDCIQIRLNEQEKDKDVDPVTATKWLIEANIRKKMDIRPGSYLRGLCREGKIIGAKRKGKKWIITK